MQPMYDVIVVGAGNAAICAALSAREQNAKVLVIERAPADKRGGNSAFTGGTFRAAYSGLEDVQKFVPDLSDDEIATTDWAQYTAEDFLDDLGRVTQYQTDPDLAETLARSSTDTVQWLQRSGVRFAPKYGRQAYKHNGRWKFYGGIVVAAVGGGRGLVDAGLAAVQQRGIAIQYETRATDLLRGKTGITGLRINVNGEDQEIYARAVVLACGGFESNREWRTRYLGPGWDVAKVRGTRYNTGDGIRMALDIGAQPYGQWSGCHAVSWDRYAPDFGDLDARVSDERNCYQFSLMINSEGKRFLDEGADFRNYTYAKYGRVVLQQPGGSAWQIFDAQVASLLRDDYRLARTKVRADTLEELVARMEDVDKDQLLKTLGEYNAAVRREIPFNPTAKDGRGTNGLAIPKSNWANPIEEPPFEAYAVGTGVTFTFGGVKIDPTTRVLDMGDAPLPGLYAAGELVGGLFYFNYPGGSGLMSGAVFGRIAGREAAKFALASAS